MIKRLKCFFLGHDSYDMCRGDSCWHCTRCGTTWHDPRLPSHGYAQGGYVGPIQLSRGHAVISYDSYRALSPEMRQMLFKDSDVEVVYSAEDVRKAGAAVLRKLQEDHDAAD